MQVPRWWQRQRARLVRLRRYAWWVAVGLMAAGLWRVESTIARLEAEVDDRKREDCAGALHVRVEQEELLEFLAAERPVFLDRVRSYYDELPDPPSCEDDDDG